MTVIKTLVRVAEGVAIPLDQDMMDQLGLDEDSDVLMVTHGAALIVSKAPGRSAPDDAADCAAARMINDYTEMLIRLAKR